jgi:thymidylate synthase
MEHNYQSFTTAYAGLIKDVYENPDFVCAPRGQKIKEKLGVKFVIQNPRARLPFIKERKFSVAYVIAEALWYLSGNNSTEWISYYSKFWRDISDDGVTANSAYGARIFKPHSRSGALSHDDGWTQWNWLIDELAADNDSRRAVVHIRSPLDSRLAKKDVPCTLTLQFFLRDDKVHQVVSMRSSDLVLGIANDIPAFTIFQELLALDLTERLKRPIGLGTYTHVSNSLHIYERNFTLVESIINTTEDLTKYDDESYAMPAMPSKPPLVDLNCHESMIRVATAGVRLTHANYRTSDPYWRDWQTILARHRCQKWDIDCNFDVLGGINWPHYGFFEE